MQTDYKWGLEGQQVEEEYEELPDTLATNIKKLSMSSEDIYDIPDSPDEDSSPKQLSDQIPASTPRIGTNESIPSLHQCSEAIYSGDGPVVLRTNSFEKEKHANVPIPYKFDSHVSMPPTYSNEEIIDEPFIPPTWSNIRHSSTPRIECELSNNLCTFSDRRSSTNINPNGDNTQFGNRLSLTKFETERMSYGENSKDSDFVIKISFDQPLEQFSDNLSSSNLSIDELLNTPIPPPKLFMDDEDKEQLKTRSEKETAVTVSDEDSIYEDMIYADSPSSTPDLDKNIDPPQLSSRVANVKSWTSQNQEHLQDTSGKSMDSLSVSNSCPSTLPVKMAPPETDNQRPCTASPQKMFDVFDFKEFSSSQSEPRTSMLPVYDEIDEIDELTVRRQKRSLDETSKNIRNPQLLRRQNAIDETKIQHSSALFKLDEKDDLDTLPDRTMTLHRYKHRVRLPFDTGHPQLSESKSSAAYVSFNFNPAEDSTSSPVDDNEYSEMRPIPPPRDNLSDKPRSERPSLKSRWNIFGHKDKKKSRGSPKSPDSEALNNTDSSPDIHNKKERKSQSSLFKRWHSTTNLESLNSKSPPSPISPNFGSRILTPTSPITNAAESREFFNMAGDEPSLGKYKVRVPCFGRSNFLSTAKDERIDIIRVEGEDGRLLGRNKDGRYGYVFSSCLFHCRLAEIIAD